MNTNTRHTMMLAAALFATVALGGCASAADEDGSDTEATSDEIRTPGGTRCLFGIGLVRGAIEVKYLSLGGCFSFLGVPTGDEQITPDGVGRFSTFANGSIYWRADIGAHVVRGEIREHWKAFGWEVGVLGYPLSDETVTPDGRGRFNVFEGGSVYWTPQTGAHEVFGAIRDQWGQLGWEAGPLGYPTSGEFDVPEGKRSNFEHGFITWNRADGIARATF